MNANEKALSFLPHGPEFRFLDRVTGLDPGREGHAEYTLRAGETFLRGHFPGAPIMPGVLVLEAAAQLAGVVAQSDPTRQPLRDLKLTALRAVKILGAVFPGETLALTAKISGRLAGLVQASVSARVGDRAILQGEVTLSGQ
jgi:3-hydroxymyristoyl/3-hydroxydecanoyl-(acyl carrier protein) dehydratase